MKSGRASVTPAMIAEPPGPQQVDSAMRQFIHAQRLAFALALGAVLLAGLVLLGSGRTAVGSGTLATPQLPPYSEPGSQPIMAARPLD
jgi:hypothetical protein